MFSKEVCPPVLTYTSFFDKINEQCFFNKIDNKQLFKINYLIQIIFFLLFKISSETLITVMDVLLLNTIENQKKLCLAKFLSDADFLFS
jgi:hypothetical protein